VTPNGVQSMRTMHGRQKETPPDLGICAGYSSHSHHAQMGFALSYRDMKGFFGLVDWAYAVSITVWGPDRGPVRPSSVLNGLSSLVKSS